MNMQVTVGADPEVFLKHGNNIISAIGRVGGSKEEPVPVECGALQEDNILAEFNINPAHSEKEFVDNINTVLGQLSAKVAPMHFDVISSAHFKPAWLKSQGLKAMEFGCDPDFNAYTGEANETPNPFTTLRTAGGHIHLGFDVKEGDIETRRDVIKMMDFYLGIPSVVLDDDTECCSLYGQAGAFRSKSYGVEYRTLSNFWIKNEAYMKWAYQQSLSAVHDVGMLGLFHNEYSEEIVRTTINESDTKLAAQIIQVLDINLNM